MRDQQSTNQKQTISLKISQLNQIQYRFWWSCTYAIASAKHEKKEKNLSIKLNYNSKLLRNNVLRVSLQQVKSERKRQQPINQLINQIKLSLKPT